MPDSQVSPKIEASVQIIKEDIQEMKPQLSQARDGVLILGTEVKNLNSRVQIIEAQGDHTCGKSGVINVVRNKLDEMQADSTGRFATLTYLQQEVTEEKRRKKWYYGWMLGLVVPLVLALIAWVTTVTTVENEIKHLNHQMQQLTVDQRMLQKRIPNIDALLQGIAKRQKTDFSKLSVIRSIPSTYERKYKELPKSAKRKLERLGFHEKDFHH